MEATSVRIIADDNRRAVTASWLVGDDVDLYLGGARIESHSGLIVLTDVLHGFPQSLH
jgi:hypothetical protein